MTDLNVTHSSTVTEDQIDHLGHMNVRWYAVNARIGTQAVLTELGWASPDAADVFDMYTRHHREQLLGSELEVRSGVLGADVDSLRIYHELSNAATGDLAATFVHRVRTNTPVDHLDTVAMPDRGAPRSIDLATDSIASAPALATLRDLGLTMRAPRLVDETDTGGGATVPSHGVPMLIWGGVEPDGSEHELVHSGPNGENFGWATMETRVGVAKLPELGARIQSFGATTAMGDKTSHMSMWSYDVDTGDLLVAFDVVNLLFNLDTRRAMAVPDEMRAEHETRLHAELAPHS